MTHPTRPKGTRRATCLKYLPLTALLLLASGTVATAHAPETDSPTTTARLHGLTPTLALLPADGRQLPPETVQMPATTIPRMAADSIYDEVEEPPQYPGGAQALFRFIRDNMKYPDNAIKTKARGRVLVQFVVNEDGSLSQVTSTSTSSTALDKEAVRLVKSMPKWIPGKHEGKAVKTRYTLPIQFMTETRLHR